MKYRKKPVVIDAWPVRVLIERAAGSWDALPGSIKAAYEKGGWVFMHGGVYVPTSHGSVFAAADDYIIEGIAGEFYPCKPDIFERTYEPVEDTP